MEKHNWKGVELEELKRCRTRKEMKEFCRKYGISEKAAETRYYTLTGSYFPINIRDKLTEEHKEYIKKWYGKKSVKEIAEYCGVKPATIRSFAYRNHLVNPRKNKIALKYPIKPVYVSVSVPLNRLKEEFEYFLLDEINKKVLAHVDVAEIKNENTGYFDYRVAISFDDSSLSDDEVQHLTAKGITSSEPYNNGDMVIQNIIFKGVDPHTIEIREYISEENVNEGEEPYIVIEIFYEDYKKLFGDI